MTDEDTTQNYEMYISVEFRKDLRDEVFSLDKQAIIEAFNKNPNAATSTAKKNRDSQYENIYKVKSLINLGFKEKIQKIQSQSTKFVKEKSCLERFFEFPPMDLAEETSDNITFYKGIII